jgi:CheY-like chemotaxis protein
VVDDVLENRVVLSEMLRSVGCEVRICASGAEAVRDVEEFRPQIAFIDMMMPGMDGAATALAIAAQCGQFKPYLVATSASALYHEQRRFRDAGFVDVLIKPLRCERVFLTLTALTGVDFEPVSSAADWKPSDRFDGCANGVANGPADGTARTQRHAASGSIQPADGNVLPDEIRLRLREAAELYSITGLKEILGEIDRLGPNGAPMAASLRRLMKRYDLQSIARFASDAANEPAVAQAD